MINNQPNVPHGEGVKAKNEKRRTRVYIRARGANSFTGGNRKTAAARRADKSRDKMHVFVGSRLSRGDLAERFTPMSPTRARLSCAHSYAAPKKRTTTEQPGHDGENRSGKKPRTRHERSDTHRHFVAGGALCRRGVYERQEKKESERRVGEQKNPSQHKVVRDGRRVTDGIRTHDIQNHNLTL